MIFYFPTLAEHVTLQVVFTGAGMSADSGVATFRKAGNSIWGGFVVRPFSLSPRAFKSSTFSFSITFRSGHALITSRTSRYRTSPCTGQPDSGLLWDADWVENHSRHRLASLPEPFLRPDRQVSSFARARRGLGFDLMTILGYNAMGLLGFTHSCIGELELEALLRPGCQVRCVPKGFGSRTGVVV